LIKIQDLLSQGSSREIAIRETNDGTITISGITEMVVNNIEDLKKFELVYNRCLITGGLSRSVGDTQMHAHSSRSHAIFTITLEKITTLKREPAFELSPVEKAVIQRSKLHLVDLAGDFSLTKAPSA
jgi:hypothetical protein